MVDNTKVIETLKTQRASVQLKLDLLNKAEEMYKRIIKLKLDNYQIVGDKPRYLLMDEYSKLSVEYEVLIGEMQRVEKEVTIEKEKMLLKALDNKIKEVELDDGSKSTGE